MLEAIAVAKAQVIGQARSTTDSDLLFGTALAAMSGALSHDEEAVSEAVWDLLQVVREVSK